MSAKRGGKSGKGASYSDGEDGDGTQQAVTTSTNIQEPSAISIATDTKTPEPAYTLSRTSAKVNIQLQSADQYDLWINRVADACWATTETDLIEITDEQCQSAESENQKSKEDWVPVVWLLITGALHNDLYQKIAHVVSSCH